jgi:hypothetical protein
MGLACASPVDRGHGALGAVRVRTGIAWNASDRILGVVRTIASRYVVSSTLRVRREVVAIMTADVVRLMASVFVRLGFRDSYPCINGL